MKEFHWNKKGLLFDPTERFDWMNAYAQVPTPLILDDRIRIYFTCRPPADAEGNFVSHTSFVDFSKEDINEIIYVHDRPVIDLGFFGSFDEFGIHPTSVLKHDEKIFLYYTGWSRGYSVPYQTWIGLLISVDNGLTFKRVSNGPIIGSSIDNPYLCNGAFVLKEDNLWRMYYASVTKWFKEKSKVEPVYTLKYAESENGINWNLKTSPILKEKLEMECISRPTVFNMGENYCMWYAFRSAKENFRDNAFFSYRLGFASSKDGINWERKDENAGINRSEDGWDSQMMCYPYVFQNKSLILMLYNGNSFGKNGFGYAQLI